MYVDAQTIVLAGSVLGAIAAFVTIGWKESVSHELYNDC